MPENTGQPQDIKAKRTAKDSVFLDLFKNKDYLLQLYQTLHPEDTTATVDSLADVTIKNILTDNLYNDLGFIVNDRLMILMEAQSTFTENILVRALLYLAQSYHEYFIRTGQNLYGVRKVDMPVPELYVIFTGERAEKPERISLSEKFFNGVDIAVEVKARVIYEQDTDDIINQYIIFCKVFNEQTKLYGLTRQAVEETIRICKDRNILREYLTSREKEVVTIMMSLFDEEEIMKSYIRSERAEAAAEAAAEATAETEKKSARDTAERMIKMGKLSLEDIALCVPSIPFDELKKLETEIMQMA